MNAKKYLESKGIFGLDTEKRYNEIIEWMEGYAQEAVKNCSIPAVVISEERAELCDNPNCEDGIVDRDYYGHPIYCQVCDSHN